MRLLGFFQQNVPGVFNYEIFGLLNFSDTLILVITNESGDVAQYSDGNLSLKDFSSSQFRIFPNPAADYISIDFGNKKFENATVEIYDTTGKLCHSANLSGQQIDVQNLAKGMYFAKVRNRDLVSTQKFIKL